MLAAVKKKIKNILCIFFKTQLKLYSFIKHNISTTNCIQIPIYVIGIKYKFEKTHNICFICIYLLPIYLT